MCQLNIQLTSHSNGGTTYCKYWAFIVHSTVVVSLAWVVNWDCEGQVGSSWRQVGWWNGSRPRVGHSLWWSWGHTTLEYHSGTKGKWTLWGGCCGSDFMVGRSYIRKKLQQHILLLSRIYIMFINYIYSSWTVPHIDISLQHLYHDDSWLLPLCPYYTPHVWLPTSRTSEVAKNWTTAFPKVGTSQRCGSCSSKKKILAPGLSQLSTKIKVLTSCPKSTLPAYHYCLSLAPPTVTHSPPEPLCTDLHSVLTLPLSTNKTKICTQTGRWCFPGR